MKVVIAYISVILIWSTTPLGIKLSVSDGDVLFPLILRTLIGLILSVFCLAFINGHIRFDRNAIVTYLSSAMAVVGAMLLSYWSAQFISSGLISVLYGLSPVVAGLLAVPILKDPFLRFHQLLGIVLAGVGLTIIFYHELHVGDEGWKGIMGILLAVFMYALSTVLVKRFNDGMSVFATNAGSLLFAMPLFMLIWFFGEHSLPAQWNPTVIYATTYLGIFGSFVGFVLYFYILKKLSAASVMLVPLITPAIAIMLGSTFNGEVVSSSTIIGAVFVLSGLLVYQLSLFGRHIILKKIG